MNFTAKSRYALKIMMDLALQEDHGTQQRQSIAQRQNIPIDFMDQITCRLKAAGLVASIRGRSGGFQLSKGSSEISLWDIFQAVEDSLYPVKCLEHESCGIENSCISIGVWDEVFTTLRKALSQKTLAESVAKWRSHSGPLSTFSDSKILKGCNRPHSRSSVSNV